MTINFKEFALDARPDRLDLRDRQYRPGLQSLPALYPSQAEISEFLPKYEAQNLILNQGKEGACTGFGLAATINYLIWFDNLDTAPPESPSTETKVSDLRVSERMLYHLARVYDEWPGEDYSGSSCRGAMKGWHRHGVCRKSLWDYDSKHGRFLPPTNDSWASDALQNPLGAYYRINHKSVVDMQAAIFEVGAIYCSASVHKGWQIPPKRVLGVMPFPKDSIGGHAFCLVGYNADGFIVQNSWGNDWGFHGFAVLSYADWVENGNDAWVVSRGVPINAGSAPRNFANHSLQQSFGGDSSPAQAGITKALNYSYPHDFPDDARPWSEEKAYEHAIVLANDGRPKHTRIEKEGPDQSLEFISNELLENWLREKPSNRKVAIYAHGGLNSEEASINRIRVMAPYFLANGIYPIFVVWKTGLAETMANIIRESLEKSEAHAPRAEGFIKDWMEKLSEGSDRAIEALARTINARGIWSEMKENAVFASDRAVPGSPQNRAGKPGGMVILARSLSKLRKKHPDLELHLIGHSAGSILLGSWVKELEKAKLPVRSCSLFAPACTLAFANRTYKRLVEKKLLIKSDLYIHNLSDAAERDDNTGKLYRKSLLYLVSRALEDIHKMPLLGLQASWDPDNYPKQKSGGFNHSHRQEAETWQAFVKDAKLPKPLTSKTVNTDRKGSSTDLAHGSFDNDIDVVEFTLKKIKRTALKPRIENLNGF